jgi:hypothetical protein
MKKAILFLVIVLSLQTANAHITVAQHSHESFMDAWAWLLIPAIIGGLLIWKFGKKKFISS